MANDFHKYDFIFLSLGENEVKSLLSSLMSIRSSQGPNAGLLKALAPYVNM